MVVRALLPREALRLYQAEEPSPPSVDGSKKHTGGFTRGGAPRSFATLAGAAGAETKLPETVTYPAPRLPPASSDQEAAKLVRAVATGKCMGEDEKGTHSPRPSSRTSRADAALSERSTSSTLTFLAGYTPIQSPDSESSTTCALVTT